MSINETLILAKRIDALIAQRDALAVEVQKLKADNENMLMNLAACSTYAIGYAIDDLTPYMVPRRAAADDVMNLRKKYDHLRSLAQNVAESLDDLLHHGIKYPNGAVHEANPEVAKEALAAWTAFESAKDGAVK